MPQNTHRRLFAPEANGPIREFGAKCKTAERLLAPDPGEGRDGVGDPAGIGVRAEVWTWKS